MSINDLLTEIKITPITDIIFDFDETLATLHIDWSRWGEEMASIIQRYESGPYNIFSHHALNELTRKHGLEFRREMIENNGPAEQRNCSGYTKHEPILRLLRQASEQSRVHLWTSNNRETVQPLLEELEIDNLFTRKVFYNDVTYIKPDPDGFTLINTDGITAEQFMFVGDSASDAGACSAAGIRFVHVDEVA
ncbi:MAG: HAD family hydrolase [Patescibacteria group bacterium]